MKEEENGEIGGKVVREMLGIVLKEGNEFIERIKEGKEKFELIEMRE